MRTCVAAYTAWRRVLYFPRPYEGELTGSLLVRASRRLGLTFRELNHVLTGHSRAENSLAYLTPAYLPELGRRTDITPRSLLWKHTIFPYACITLDKTEAETLESSLTIAESSAIEKLPIRLNSIYPPRIKVISFRRYCEECKEEELRNFGESYWHVSHALPGVAICTTHMNALRMCDLRLAPRAIQAQSLLPHEVRLTDEWLHDERDVILALAQQTERSFCGSYALTGLLHTMYRDAAEALGYQCERYRQNRYRLVTDLERYVGAELLQEMGVPVRSGAPTAWPLTLIDGHHSVPQAQLKHVLLRAFLEHAAGRATPWLNTGSASSSRSSEVWPPTMSVATVGSS
ncbi:TniQ family protein [Paraburkholderia graminis]|uniref:TniQ family protein n=1 Tax=Paraburkholderia graminis TaxID=60548 RepID=UPI0009DC26C6